MKTRLLRTPWHSPARLALWVALPMAHTPHLEGRMRMILDTTRPRRALTRRALLVALLPVTAVLVSLAMLRPEARAQAVPASAPNLPSPVLPSMAAAPRPVQASGLPAYPAKASVARSSVSPTPPYSLLRQQGGAMPQSKTPALPPLKAASVASAKAPVRLAQLPPVPAPAGLPVPPAAVPPPVPITPATARPPAPADVSLQLVGVTDGQGKWWNSAGTLLPQPLYDTAAYHSGPDDYWRKNVESGKPALDFAFRVSPADAKDVTIRFSLQNPNAPWTSSWGTWMEKMQGQDGQTEAQLNRSSAGLRVLSVSYSAAPTPGVIRADVASGPWKVAVSGYVSAAGPSQSYGEHAYFFSQLFEADGKSRVVITTNDTERDVRVVAVNAQGQEILPTEIGDSSAGAMSQINALFALPASQIKRMRVETRPFHPIEFKDVPVQPAP